MRPRMPRAVLKLLAITFAVALFTPLPASAEYPIPIAGDQYGVTRSVYTHNTGVAQVVADGFCLDAEGNLWTVENDWLGLDPNATRLAKYSPGGLLLAEYREGLGLRYPTSMAFAPNGLLYITDAALNWAVTDDTEWDPLAGTGRIVIVNPSDGSFVGTFPSGGQPGPVNLSSVTEAADRFKCPIDIDFTSDGSFVVTDWGYNRVTKFNALLEPQQQIGSIVPGSDSGQFDHPAGSFLEADGTIWVADTYNNRIERFGSDGIRTATYGGSFLGAPGETLYEPRDVLIDEHGVVFATDWTPTATDFTGRFVRFTQETEWLGSYRDTVGGEAVMLPWDIRVDANGSVWTSDAYADIFDGAVREFALNPGPPDVTPPVTTSDVPPSWARPPVTVHLTATDASTTVSGTFFSTDGTFPSQSFVDSIPVSAEGTTSLKYFSVDRVGNAEVVVTENVLIDATPPVTQASMETTYYGGAAVIPFTSSDNLSGVLRTEFFVDGNGPYYDPWAYSTIQGTHQLRYYSIDRAGNIETANVAYFTITPPDEDPPVTTWLERRTGWFTENTPMTLSATDTVSGVEGTYFRLGASDWTTYTAPLMLTQEGTRQLEFYSVDLLGHKETTRTGTISIDKTNPVTTANVPVDPIGSGTVTFEATDTVSGVERTEWRIGSTGEYTVGNSVYLPTYGTYNIYYRSLDVAGNFENPRTVTVVIERPDEIPPTTSSNIPDSGWVRGPRNLILMASDYEGGSGVMETWLKVDDGPWIAYVPDTHTFQEGQYEVSWYSVDFQNNEEEIQTKTLRVDSTPPVSSSNAQPFYAGPAIINITATDNTSTATPWYRVDGGAALIGSTILLSEYRTYNLEFWATDGAGNEELPHHFVTIAVSPPDTVPPVTTLTAPTGWQKGFLTFSLSAVDASSSVQSTQYSLNGGLPWTYYTPVSVVTEGVNNLDYWSTDIYNNREATKTAQLMVDASAPFTSSDATSTYVDQAVITLAPEDPYSGVATTYYRVNGGAWQQGTSIVVDWSRWRKNHTVEYYSVDNVANIEGIKSKTFEIRLNPIAYNASDSRVTYRGTWYSINSGDAMAADESGAFAYIAFQGSRLDLLARKGPGMGRMTASIVDTTTATETFSLYDSSSRDNQYVWTTGDLEYDNYVVKVEWTGQKDAASSGTVVNIDDLRIEGVLSQVPDTEAPVTTHDAPTGWVRGPVSVTLSSTDATTGVQGIYVTTDGTTPTEADVYSGPVVISAQGQTTVKFYAKDYRGNVEGLKTALVKIDDVAPVTNSTAVSSYITTASIALLPTDPHSGTAYTKWRLDEGVWTTGTAVSVPATALGEHTLEWYSVDGVGNVEATRTATFVMLQRYEETDSRVYLKGTWNLTTNSGLSGGSFRISSVTGAAAHITFDGTRIDWITSKNTTYGKARLVLDGGDPVLVDLYGSFAFKQTVWSSGELAPGVHTLSIEYAGVKNDASTGYTIGVDAFDLTGTLIADSAAPVTTSSATGEWRSNPETITLAATDANSWVASTRYSVDGAASQLYTTPFPVSAEGVHTVEFWSVDGAGNTEATKTATVRIDRDAPNVYDDAPIEWVQGPVSVTLAATDGGSGVDAILYSTDGSAPSLPYNSAFTVAAEGTTTVKYLATDNVGNTTGVSTAQVRIDDTSPATTDDAPSGWVNGPVSITLDGSDALSGVSATSYRVDGGPTLGYIGEPIVIDTEGVHTVEYSSVDAAGNVEATKTATVRIDDSAPSSASDAPATWVNGPVSVTITATDSVSSVAHVYYSIDGSYPTLPYAEPVVIDAQGATELRFRAVDAAGNSESANSATVRIDDVAPTVLASAPIGWVQPPAMVSLSADDAHSGVAQILFGIDVAEPVTVFDGPFGVVPEGESTVSFRAADTLGNLSDVATATVRVDGTAPSTSANVAATYDRVSSVLLVPNDALSGIASTYYRIDGGQWTQGTLATLPFVGGPHTLEWYSIDVAGNVESAKSASFAMVKRFEQDDFAASYRGTWNTVSHGSLSGGSYRTTSLTGSSALFVFSGTQIDLITSRNTNLGIARITLDDTDTYEVDLFGAFAFQQRVWSSGLLEQGVHTVRIDYSNTKNAASTGYAIGVDALDITGELLADTAPPTTASDIPGGWRPGNTTVTLTASDDRLLAATYYRINGGSTTTYLTPFTVTVEGTTTIEYWSVDGAGNTEATHTAYVRIDRTAPTPSDDAPAMWSITPVLLTLSATDTASGTSHILYSTDGSSPTLTYSGPLSISSDGTTTVKYSAVDNLGNASSIRTVLVRVDRTLPTASDNAPTTWRNTSAIVTLSGADSISGLAAIKYSLNGGQATTYTAPVAVSGQGVHYLTYQSFDAAGNASASKTATISIDTTAPTTTATVAASYAATATVPLVSTDTGGSGTASTFYRINGGSWIASSTATIPYIGGAHTIDWYSTDRAGNVEMFKSATYTITKRFEQNARGIAFTGTWSTVNHSGLSDGSFKTSFTASSTVNVAFTGTSIDWITSRNTTYGKAWLTLDDNAPILVDLYGNFAFKQKVWSSGALANGTHTLKIEYSGLKNDASSGHTIGIDAFDITGEPGARRYEQTDPLLSAEGSWTGVNHTGLSGGSYHTANTAGSAVNIAFNGTSIEWITSKNTTFGRARVTLDSATTYDVDLYGPFSFKQTVWSSGELADGPHKLRIEFLGTKNDASTGYAIGIDALDVVGVLTQASPPDVLFEQNDPKIVYEGNWSTVSSGGLSGGSYRTANGDPNAAVNVAFSGKSIDWITSTNTSFGKARVQVDGGDWTEVDLYGAFGFKKKVWSSGVLADGPHTLRIEYLGTKNSSSTGNTIGVDAFSVYGSLTQAVSTLPPGTRYEDTSPLLVWAGDWGTNFAADYSEGKQRVASASGQIISIKFTGTRMYWIGARNTNYGQARITLDGDEPVTIDCFGSYGLKQMIWQTGELADGVHTVTIEALGTKSGDSSGTWISVDALEVVGTLLQAEPLGPEIARYEQDAAGISYTGDWDTTNHSSLSGGSFKTSNTTSASVDSTFTGTSIGWVTSLNTNYGKARVQIDGGEWTVVDLYGPFTFNKTVWTSGMLAEGTHTIRIERTGLKHDSSSGYVIGIDAFDIAGTLTQ